MPNDVIPATNVAKNNPGHRFEIGHPRYGGKRRNSTQQVRDLCADMDVDPMRFMLSLIKDGITTQVVMENGKKKKIEVIADLATRTDLAKFVSRFMYPTLTATQVSGQDGGPIETQSLNITALLQNPDDVEAVQRLALRLLLPEPSQDIEIVNDGKRDECARQSVDRVIEPIEPPKRDHNGHYTPR
jgi:hypothetical protein